ncbi:MAG: VRR-NUC domain-containing protein, partial [Ferruginibacter sp.]|nr:VRR-NUC domain-containing protein [Cytophagales bacterium]
ARPVFDKFALRMGALLERNRLNDQALLAYQHTDQPPSPERRVRLLHKLGRLPEALALCERMRAGPQNADEKYFATDFMARLEAELGREPEQRGARLPETLRTPRKSTTLQLQASEAIRVDAGFRHRVEQGVIHHLTERGYRAVHSENYLWCGFCGLLLWDIIFDEDQQAIHHPLQRAPSDLHTPRFLEKRQTQILDRLKILHRREECIQLLQRTHAEKYGMGNPLVGWHESLLDLVMVCYQKIQPAQLERLVLEMARNLRENTRGFPDLFAWNDEEYCLIEVKSPNDHLSAQQLYWLHFFHEIGIPAKVLRVEFMSQ